MLEKVSQMQQDVRCVDFPIFDKKHAAAWAEVTERFNQANTECTADSQEVTEACFR